MSKLSEDRNSLLLAMLSVHLNAVTLCEDMANALADIAEWQGEAVARAAKRGAIELVTKMLDEIEEPREAPADYIKVCLGEPGELDQGLK